VLDQRNVRNHLLAIKSLLLHSPETPAVTVLSDGTLRPVDVHQLQKHIPGIRVLAKEGISRRQPLVLFLDSDVLFHRQLPANFLRLSKGIAATYNRDHDHSRYDPHFRYLKDYARSAV
jgi:hypothetical protein